MISVTLPDGSRLGPPFPADPKRPLWKPGDFDFILRALRGGKQDILFMQSLRRTFASDGGPAPSDDELFRKVAYAVLGGQLAWELPPPIAIGSAGGGSSAPSEKSSSPPPSKSQPAPPPKSEPPPAPKPAPAPPPKPKTPPPPKAAPPPSPQPPPTPKPSSPPVPTVNVNAGASIVHPQVPRPELDEAARLACAHDWVQITTPKMQETLDDNIRKAACAKQEGAKESARGYLFENHAIKQNEKKMNIQYVGVHFGCTKCGQTQEVDIIGGDHQLGEVKSRGLLGNLKSIRTQAPRLASIHRQICATNDPPLVKLLEGPKLKLIKKAWEDAGWRTEVIQKVIWI